MSDLLLHNQTMLVLGVDDLLSTQMCLNLALEGAHVIGVGTDSNRLTQIKREIDDIQGQFEVIDLSTESENQPHQTDLFLKPLLTQFSAIHCFINFYNNHHWGVFSHIPFQDYSDLIQHAPIQDIFQTLRDHYPEAIAIDVLGCNRQTGSNGGRTVDLIPSLELVSEAAIASNDIPNHDDPDQSNIHGSAAQSYRMYLEERFDANNIPESTSSSQHLTLSPIFSSKIPPSYVFDEILNLTTRKEFVETTDLLLVVTDESAFLESYNISKTPPYSYRRPVISQSLGAILPVYVKETLRGRAVFARKAITQGTLVLKTTGKAIAHQTEHSLQIGWDKHFEPDAPIRLINHSCDPNLGVKTNAQGVPDFFALRDIQPDEELTFDYAMTEFTHQPRQNPALEFDLVCQCGMKNCRGKLGYYSELHDDLKKKYEGFISDYLVEWDQAQLFE